MKRLVLAATALACVATMLPGCDAGGRERTNSVATTDDRPTRGGATDTARTCAELSSSGALGAVLGSAATANPDLPPSQVPALIATIEDIAGDAPDAFRPLLARLLRVLHLVNEVVETGTYRVIDTDGVLATGRQIVRLCRQARASVPDFP